MNETPMEIQTIIANALAQREAEEVSKKLEEQERNQREFETQKASWERAKNSVVNQMEYAFIPYIGTFEDVHPWECNKRRAWGNNSFDLYIPIAVPGLAPMAAAFIKKGPDQELALEYYIVSVAWADEDYTPDYSYEGNLYAPREWQDALAQAHLEHEEYVEHCNQREIWKAQHEKDQYEREAQNRTIAAGHQRLLNSVLGDPIAAALLRAFVLIRDSRSQWEEIMKATEAANQDTLLWMEREHKRKLQAMESDATRYRREAESERIRADDLELKARKRK